MGYATSWTIRTPGSATRRCRAPTQWHQRPEAAAPPHLRLFPGGGQNATAVPDHWIRRQTLAGEERFITPDLKGRRAASSSCGPVPTSGNMSCSASSGNRWGPWPPRSARRPAPLLPSMPSPAWPMWLPAVATAPPPSQMAGGLQLEASRHPVVEQRLVETAFTPDDVQLGRAPIWWCSRAPTPVARAAIYARSA